MVIFCHASKVLHAIRDGNEIATVAEDAVKNGKSSIISATARPAHNARIDRKCPKGFLQEANRMVHSNSRIEMCPPSTT